MTDRRYWFPKPYADAVAKLRVPAGFVLLAAFLYLAAPDTRSLAIGTPIAFCGLLLRAWASGHLEKNRQLAVSGPYSYLRNPLYLGTLLAAAGFVIAARRWELGILFAAIFGLIYLPVIELEEQRLRELFPSYGDYARRVPMLVPRLRRPPNPRKFRWELYMVNEEYQAGIGFLAGLAVLIWKAVH